jgi:hypothetical protein
MKRPSFHLSLPALNWRDKMQHWITSWLLPEASREYLLSGQVRTAEGEPLAFARVDVRGTQYATEANAAGYFVLHVPEVLFRHSFSLFASADGFVRGEQRLNGAPGEPMIFELQPERLAKVVVLHKRPA